MIWYCCQVISETTKEAGCHQANLFQEIGNTAEAGSERSGLGPYFVIIFSSLRFIIVSNWESEAALERHLKTTHVRDFAKLIADKGSIEHFRRYKKIIWWDLYKNQLWNKRNLIPIFTFFTQKTRFVFEAHLKVINVFRCHPVNAQTKMTFKIGFSGLVVGIKAWTHGQRPYTATAIGLAAPSGVQTHVRYFW